MKEKRLPKIGVGVIIKREGKVLMGLRKGSHGRNKWSFPGGHLEFNETFESCACREVREETGLLANKTRFVAATNDIMDEEGLHYVTIFMEALVDGGVPEVCEPDRCERWDWFSPEEMPEDLFLPIENLIKNGYKF